MKTIFNLAQLNKEGKELANKRHEILNSKDYLKLKEDPLVTKVFKRYFEEDVLNKYSISELEKVQNCIPYVQPVAMKLIEFLKYGNIKKIDFYDAPNFMDEESMKRILTKYNVRNKKHENVSNLADDDFLKLFDKKLIRSYKEYESCGHKEKVNYCISLRDIQKHTAYHTISIRNSALRCSIVLSVNILYLILLNHIAYTKLGVLGEIVLLILSFLYLILG